MSESPKMMILFRKTTVLLFLFLSISMTQVKFLIYSKHLQFISPNFVTLNSPNKIQLS